VLGEGDALEFALSGRSIDAEEALRIGLISRIDDDPRSVAEEIATNETDALVALKRRIRDDGERATQETTRGRRLRRPRRRRSRRRYRRVARVGDVDRAADDGLGKVTYSLT